MLDAGIRPACSASRQDAPGNSGAPYMGFSTLGLSEILYTSLGRHGYERPTPVQQQAIPIVLTGSDLLARAQTGTGKTAAFGLPMIDRLLVRSQRRQGTRAPRGLV